MAQEIDMKDFAISNNVISSIVTAAVEKIDGVAYVMGHNAAASLLSIFTKQAPASSDAITSAAEDGYVSVTVPVAVFFGYDFPDIAEEIRKATASALNTQIGIQVDEVNVRIDQLIFPKE